MDNLENFCLCGHDQIEHGDISFMDGLGNCFNSELCGCKEFKPRLSKRLEEIEG